MKSAASRAVCAGGRGSEDQAPGGLGLMIRYDLMRTDKSLSEITPADVPRGFDPEDVAREIID